MKKKKQKKEKRMKKKKGKRSVPIKNSASEVLNSRKIGLDVGKFGNVIMFYAKAFDFAPFAFSFFVFHSPPSPSHPVLFDGKWRGKRRGVVEKNKKKFFSGSIKLFTYVSQS